VARNAYGRQRESFEAQLAAPAIDADPFRIAFIRAPVVTRVGQAVQVLATHGNTPVLLQEGRLLVSSFHPEITDYRGIHLYFSQIVRSANTK
jgi:5'-phosphate synthase pdxT subunit